MSADYPTEEVECGACDGCGQVEYEGDYGFDDLLGACLSCGGSGVVEVCENCYDDWNGCTVCRPECAVGAGDPDGR